MKRRPSFLLFFLMFNYVVVFAAPLNGNYPLAPGVTAAEARQKVIEAGKKYEGTPYLYSGMTERGLDCSGFIYVSFYDALGVSLPRSAARLYSWVERISIKDAQPGDLVFFRTGTSRSITHVGLYLGDLNFIHSASSGRVTGVIYSKLTEQYWAHAYAGVGRALPAISQ